MWYIWMDVSALECMFFAMLQAKFPMQKNNKDWAELEKKMAEYE